MATALLVAFGAAGDFHTTLGLGLALRARGHRVRVLSHGYFEPFVRGAGLEYGEIASAEEFLALTREPQLDRLGVAIRRLGDRAVLPAIPRVYRAVEAEAARDDTVVVASALDLGAKLAHERLGVPLVIGHIHTFYLRSAHDRSVLPLPLPPLARRAVYRAMDAAIDRLWGKPVDAFRREVGLPPAPVSRTLWGPAGRGLGLFPEWFAPRRPDWPADLRCTGFPLYDERRAADLPDDVRRFVESGEPPIVFTTASWMRHAPAFFEVSVRVCQRLGRRGLLVTRFREQVPASLPPGVAHTGFAPYAWLLPRSAAVVHHGGVGTLARALAAGIPQLVSPLNVDQPYNAERLRALGVAETVRPSRYRAERVAGALDRLLASSGLHRRAGELARRIREAPALEASCRRVEEALAARGCAAS